MTTIPHRKWAASWMAGARVGIADIRDAFNSIAEPAGFTCSQAFMDMTIANGKEWQVLTFSGIRPDGAPFSIKSGLIASDLAAAARETARVLIAGPPAP